MWDLFSWSSFTRAWVIQEVILSYDPWVACGYSLLPWEALFDAYNNLTARGISRWLQRKFAHTDVVQNNNHRIPVGDRLDVLQSVLELDTGKHKAPASFAEVFCFLLDESTGRSPTLSGQTYSSERPKGKGGFELSSLDSRAVGRTFEAFRVAVNKALRNRCLGITEKCRLSLVPRYSKVGYSVCVLQCSHVPFVIRAAGEPQKKFHLV